MATSIPTPRLEQNDRVLGCFIGVNVFRHTDFPAYGITEVEGEQLNRSEYQDIAR